MNPSRRIALALLLVFPLAWTPAQQGSRRGGVDNAFPGGTNPDGSLRPTPPVTRLFSQDAYTEYALLAPGSEQFRIRFLPEETRAGATELVNATRGGSEGSGVEVYDPRTGKPLPFTYRQQGDDPENHAIRATLPIPVPEGGIGRVLIYKTYKDARTYMIHGGDIVWVRSLSGYRLGVVLPPGFSFISSNVAAQLTTLPDGRLKLAFANPSGQSNPVTIHAHKTTANLTPLPYTDMFFGAQDKWVTARDYRDALARLVKLGGMSRDEFDNCLKNTALENKIVEGRLIASKELDVNSTPTFFINGTKFTGAPTVEEFDKALSGLAAKS